MEIPFDFNTFIHLAAIVLGIVSGIVIFYFGIKSNAALQPLGIAQLSIPLAIAINFLLVTKLIIYWPFLYRLGNIFALIFLPMPLLHLAFFTQKRSWKWFDLFHFTPLFLYVVDHWDFLILPAQEKLTILKLEVNDLDLMYQFRQSKYFGPRFHLEFRTVTFSLYWLAQLLLFKRWMRRQYSNTKTNNVWRNWILVFLGCQFLLWFPFYLNLLGLNAFTTYFIINSFSVVWVLLLSFSIFFFPAILYGPKLTEHFIEINKAKAGLKSPLSVTERQKLEEIMLRMDAQMDDKRHFLTIGYSISAFSHDMALPTYQISKCLNVLKGVGFVDYIHQKRIQHCIFKFNQQGGGWMNLTLEAIAKECGFSNRNSFTKSFIKYQGESPSEYRMRLSKAG